MSIEMKMSSSTAYSRPKGVALYIFCMVLLLGVSTSFGEGLQLPVNICPSEGKPIHIHVERDKIFQPFYRLETSRTTPGSGLGLSLVSAIDDLHAITINISDNRPDLRVTLFFPTTSTSKL